MPPSLVWSTVDQERASGQWAYVAAEGAELAGLGPFRKDLAAGQS